MKSGFLLVDKPAGISSFGVLRNIRKKLQVKKIGHAGTLDAFATGLLVVAAEEATKALSSLILFQKSYAARIVFGVTSDTLDTEGKIVFEKNIPNIAEEKLQKVLTSFLGENEQTPPLYSALKMKGKRASDRVRAGEEIFLLPRNTHIFDIQILRSGTISEGVFSHFPYADIFLEVSSGFYVRSFARDIGKAFGTVAICINLRRKSVGAFSLENAVPADSICEKDIFSVCPEHFSIPHVSLSQKQAEEFFHGRRFPIVAEEGKISVFLEKKWIGFAEKREGILYPKNVVLPKE